MIEGTRNDQTLLLIGGNRGDVRAAGEWVIAQLKKKYHVELVSSWYSSPAWGFEGPDFLNQVIGLQKVGNINELLDFVLDLEQELGRKRTGEGYADRAMDIDILYHGNEVIATDRLEVPHPRLHERRFTLLPLNEFWASFVHPALNKTQEQLLVDCDDKAEVTWIQ